MVRYKRISLKLTKREYCKVEELWDFYKNTYDISQQRKSELFTQGIINHLNNLIASHIPTTQTKLQTSKNQRKENLQKINEEIKLKGFMYVMQCYNQLILCNECFKETKMRTRSSYFQLFLQSENIYLINISYYNKTQRNFPIIMIHKESKWWPQLKDLCFKINKPLFQLTHDQISDSKFSQKLFRKLCTKSKYKSKLDKAEEKMLNEFLYEMDEIENLPKNYDSLEETVIDRVIELRSEHRFEEANQLLKKEISSIQKV